MNRAIVSVAVTGLLLASGAAAQQQAIVPDMPTEGINYFPFGSIFGDGIMHQVISSDAITQVAGNQPILIESIAFAPHADRSWNAGVRITLAYTNHAPGALDIPSLGGNGVPNAVGPVHLFLDDPSAGWQFVEPPPGVAYEDYFQMVYTGTTFKYDPALGNLLVEVNMTSGANTMVGVSRVDGGALASRAVNRDTGGAVHPQIALRMELTYSPLCYADCNDDAVLNIADFLCFIDEFAAAQTLPPAQQQTHYANCSGATSEPFLTVADFLCFIDKFAAGCP